MRLARKPAPRGGLQKKTGARDEGDSREPVLCCFSREEHFGVFQNFSVRCGCCCRLRALGWEGGPGPTRSVSTGSAAFPDPGLPAHLHQHQLGRGPLQRLLPVPGECA